MGEVSNMHFAQILLISLFLILYGCAFYLFLKFLNIFKKIQCQNRSLIRYLENMSSLRNDPDRLKIILDMFDYDYKSGRLTEDEK